MRRWLLVFVPYLVSSSVSATTLSTPPGLHPGDVYERVFVTSQTFIVVTFASNPPLNPPFPSEFHGLTEADYQVTSAAHDGGLLPNWTGQTLDYRAILSDGTVNAKDRLNIQGPIYNMQNELIATSAADLWSGSIHHAIRYDEFGNSVPATTIQSGNRAEPTAVWTGTQASGQGTAATANSWTSPNTFIAALGDPFKSDSGWVHSTSDNADTKQHFYGMSGPITVVPEPSSVVLAVLGVLALAVLRFRRRRQCN